MMYVLDACTVIATAKNERGADVVDRLFSTAGTEFVIHAINLCEVYYHFLKHGGEAIAHRVIRDVEHIGVRVDESITRRFWMEVGQAKNAIGNASLADCFAIALANRLGGAVLTSDHGEFDNVARIRYCNVEFIR